MTTSQSKVEQIQSSVADYLSRHQALRGVKVFEDRSSSLDEKFDEKLTPKIGLSVLVKRPSVATASVVLDTVTFDSVLLTVRVVENLLTNDSGLSAATLAEIILKDLITFTPVGATSAFVPRATYPWFQQVGTTTTNVVEIIVVTTATLN